MRTRVLSVLVIVMITAGVASAQSVIITPKKVVYRRTAKSVPDWKRTFEVRYPIFSGKVGPAVLRNLKTSTDYWRIFDMKFADNLRDEHWLSNFDYQVKYNKHNILEIWLYIEGIGAYPDGSTKYVVLDTRTGNRLAIRDLFLASRMPDLLGRIRGVMKRSEEEASTESEEVREALQQHYESFPELHPTAEKIEFKDLTGFAISDTGVTFMFDYGYAHVIQALEPSGEFFLSYAELKPFIRTDGLLARFAR